MARLGLICLALAGFMVIQATIADKSQDLELNPFGEVKFQDGVFVREAEHSVSVAAEPSSESMQEAQEAEAPTSRRLGPGKHHSSDKSVAGGGVIIGGLVTTIFAAVFCYIRVTRRRGGVY
ncbi:hypothetical protein ACE6H2_011830 [Prunus campanulata]